MNGNQKARVRVKICGNDFFVASEDNEEYIRRIADMVDDHIRRQMENAPSMSTSMAAIFTAMDFCDEAVKAKETADNLRQQVKDYLEEAAEAQAQAEEWRRRAEQATRELQSLKAKVPQSGRQDSRR